MAFEQVKRTPKKTELMKRTREKNFTLCSSYRSRPSLLGSLAPSSVPSRSVCECFTPLVAVAFVSSLVEGFALFLPLSAFVSVVFARLDSIEKPENEWSSSRALHICAETAEHIVSLAIGSDRTLFFGGKDFIRCTPRK